MYLSLCERTRVSSVPNILQVHLTRRLTFSRDCMTYYTGTVDPRDFTSVLRGENGGARVIMSLMTIMISAACSHNMLYAGRTEKTSRGKG